MLVCPEGPLPRICEVTGAFPTESWLKGMQAALEKPGAGLRHVVLGACTLPCKIVLDMSEGCCPDLGGSYEAVLISNKPFIGAYVITALYCS